MRGKMPRKIPLAFEAVENKPFVQYNRANQRTIIPSGIKNRNLGNFAASTTLLATASTALNNGDQAVFTITTSHDFGFDLLAAEVYIAMYVGAVAGANELPGGSGIDESQWQVIGPYHSYSAWDGEKDSSTTRVYVRNISAGASQTVTLRTVTKYLSNNENA